MDNANTQLERGDEPICHTFRGTSADERIRRKLIYTDFLTPSRRADCLQFQRKETIAESEQKATITALLYLTSVLDKE